MECTYISSNIEYVASSQGEIMESSIGSHEEHAAKPTQYTISDETRILNEFARANRFSPREREVVSLLVAGKQAKEIARELDLAVCTVKEYVGSAYRKAGVTGRGPLLAKFLSYCLADALTCPGD